MTDTAAAQLRRILHIIPQLAEDREIPLGEVAEKVGVSPAALLKDLKSLTERFDTGGFSDGLSLFIEDDCVSLNSNHFRRPMRLTRSELRALELGLAMLRAELPPDERTSAETARTQIAKVVVKLPADNEVAESHYLESGAEGSPVFPTLRNAFATQQQVRIAYHKGDDTDPTERLICPYSFVVANGKWYVIGYCHRSEGVRVFRMDRIRSAVTVADQYSLPESFKVAEFTTHGRAFSESPDQVMTVRYSPRIAKWIAEREDGSVQDDGSLIVDHPLADQSWGVRHVLQYGPDAEILAPIEMRHAIAKALKSAGTAVAGAA